VTAPAPAPVATVTTPLANGKLAVGLTWSTDKGELAAGVTTGVVTFDAQGALLEVDDVTTGHRIVEKGTPVDANADGVIAWGRWTGGKSKVDDTTGAGKGNLSILHYFAVQTVPTIATFGTFTSFASTAPTVQSGGNLVATGVVNSATGSFDASIVLILGGNATYSLHVPVAGQTFSLAGVASANGASAFSGVSTITSTGTGCTGGCTGSLGNNVSVIGQIGGVSSSRAGVLYGFDSTLGNVSGVIVFKH
jgi:hypothetical protein